MADFYAWQSQLVPSWLRGAVGTAWQLAMGYYKDGLTRATKEAVKARFPLLAPSDALSSIGSDRLLEKMPQESLSVYRTLLRTAWDEWAKGGTKRGLLDAIERTGLAQATLYSGQEVNLDFSGSELFNYDTWPRYVIVLSNHPWQSDGIWDDDGTWDDGGTWDSNARTDEVALILRQVRLWAGAHAECVFIIVPFGNIELWDIPPDGVWDEPGSIWDDGGAAYWELLLQEEHMIENSFVEQVFRWLGMGRYTADPEELMEGEVAPLGLTKNGALRVDIVGGTVVAGEPAPASLVHSTTLEKAGTIRTSPGYLLELSGFINADTERWLLLWDAPTPPTDGVSTISPICQCFRLPAGGMMSWTPPRPVAYEHGITWVLSTSREAVQRPNDGEFYLSAALHGAL